MHDRSDRANMPASRHVHHSADHSDSRWMLVAASADDVSWPLSTFHRVFYCFVMSCGQIGWASIGFVLPPSSYRSSTTPPIPPVPFAASSNQKCLNMCCMFARSFKDLWRDLLQRQLQPASTSISCDQTQPCSSSTVCSSAGMCSRGAQAQRESRYQTQA